MANPFDGNERTQHSHFLLHFYGAVLRLLMYVDRLTPPQSSRPESSDPYPFLEHYRSELQSFVPDHIEAAESADWWEAQIEDWQRGCSVQLPLVALEQLPGVGKAGRITFMLAGLTEEDARFGTIFAQIQHPLPARRLTLGLAGQLIAADGWETCHALLNVGALEAGNPAASRAEWMLQAPSLVWDAARGSTNAGTARWFVRHAYETFPTVDDLILPQESRQRLAQASGLLRLDQARALVLRGTPGSDRLHAAGAVARDLNRQIIEVLPPAPASPDADSEPLGSDEVQQRVLGILCTLTDAMPVFGYDLGPGETKTVPELSGYIGPVFVLLGAEGGLRGPVAEQALTITLPPLDLPLRLRAWQEAIGTTPADDLPQIAQRFMLPGAYIRQAAAMARAEAGLAGRKIVRPEDVRRATRGLNRQILDTLADHIGNGASWRQLVANPTTMDKLQELQQRCLYREQLLDHLGPAFGSNSNRGVRALFSGTSGTGKTLAARVLAAELGMDLYRVDLASVINKYIGETEKNLHQVLARAEELDVILLLDEGDALLGQRTDVKSSNDRYANLETNYLLQRLEHYQGIVLVTTNAAQNIDTAFQRRMDVVVHFVPPQVDERVAIWQLHVPEENVVGYPTLMAVATRCDLTGGQIRNAAQLATLLAVSEGGQPVGDRHLDAAVRAEYRKAGAVCPLGNGRSPERSIDRMDEMLRVLA